jgi:hypothetical protein
MSRETRMATKHSTPMPQRSESGVSARYETKVFSLWDRKRGAKLKPSPMKLPGYRNGSAGVVAQPFDGAILLESFRVALQS